MNLPCNSWMRVARWVAALAALALVIQPLLGSAFGPALKAEGCCDQCRCCVSRDSGNAPAPALPGSSRTFTATDLQFVATVGVLPAPAIPESAVIAAGGQTFSFTASLPLFLRHRTLLI